MFNINFIEKVIACFIGAYGFALVFNLNKKYHLYVGLLGSLNYAVYYLVFIYSNNIFLSTLIAALFSECVVQILTRLLKTPRIILSITAIVPLIPGGSLYHFMRCFVNKLPEVNTYASELGQFVLGIAVGTALVMATTIFISRLIKDKK